MSDTRTDPGREPPGTPDHRTTVTVESPAATGHVVRPRKPSRRLRDSLLLMALGAVAWAVWTSEVELDQLLTAPGQLLIIFELMFTPPDWSYFGVAFDGTIESVHIAWIGTLMGAILSLPLGLLAATNLTSSATSGVVRQILNAFRSVPELVLAILFVSMIGLGPLPGALAIGIHSIGTLGKWASEVIEGIDAGPLEAAEAVGARRAAVMRWGVVPQVLPEIVAFWLYRFEINIRASAILGVVGAGGVGGVLQNTLTYREFDKAGMTIIVVIAITILIDMVSSRIRRRLIEGPAAAPDVGHDGDPLHGPQPREVAAGDVPGGY